MRKLSLVLALIASLIIPMAAATADDGITQRKPKISVEADVTMEDAGVFEITVSLSHATHRNVRFELGFWRGGDDRVKLKTAKHRTFVIKAGQTEKTIQLRIRDDEVQTPDERIGVKLKDVRGARAGKTRSIGVVYDDEGGAPGDAVFDLTALHINDQHSHLAQEDIGLTIDGVEIEYELGGFARVVAQMKAREAALTAAGDNVVKVHAGDAVSGTLFYTLFLGEADAALMNEACFDVFELGNHEFDGGDGVLASFLEYLNAGDCGTTTLGANVLPAVGTPLAPETSRDFIKPFVIKEYNGVEVGFIGLDIAGKTQGSSSPLPTTQFFDEAETAQKYIDRLTRRGVRNIVLVTHFGYDNDIALASQLVGVDAIIGGDSHTLLGDFDQYGLSSQGPYPTFATDAVGNDVCIAHAWEHSKLVGEIELSFDDAGRINSCNGYSYLLLGEEIPEDGADPVNPTITDPQLAFVEPDANALDVLAEFEALVDELGQQVIGTASEDICQGRFPNDGRSVLCAVGDLPNGGEIQQLVTEGFLVRAFRADIALQNSGGVRIDIPAGDISIAEAYELLPFANTLFELDMTGAEILLALEQGMDWALNPDGSTGAFPYGSGIRWDLDASQPFGSRFSNVEVMPKGATEWEPIDEAAVYVVAANSFMAGGGDGYEILADVVADGRGVDTFLDYAQSFIDWIVEDQGGTIAKPTVYSLKSYIPA